MRGIELDGKKEATLLAWTLKRALPPKRVLVPLDGATPCVEAGDKVLAGQKIAEPARPDAVAAHASTSGQVASIAFFPHPFLGEYPAVEIVSDQRDERVPEAGKERRDWDRLEREELLSLFRENGLMAFGLKPEPLHIKTGSPASLLILNGCESEPYVTSGHALMMSHPVEVLKGAEILRKVIGAPKAIFATEKNKTEIAELFKSKIFFLKWNHFEARTLPVVFPQEDERLLIAEIAPGTEAVVFDVATAFAVYEAVVMQKPLYERAVTVGGECIIEPKNYWARVGTEFSALVKNARGLLREPGKVVMNGPMRGPALSGFDFPLVKETSAILALAKEAVRNGEVHPCIRCGLCLDVCPPGLSPAMVSMAAENRLWDVAREYGAEFCIGCGNCSYACPSNRPMIQLVLEAAAHA